MMVWPSPANIKNDCHAVWAVDQGLPIRIDVDVVILVSKNCRGGRVVKKHRHSLISKGATFSHRFVNRETGIGTCDQMLQRMSGQPAAHAVIGKGLLLESSLHIRTCRRTPRSRMSSRSLQTGNVSSRSRRDTRLREMDVQAFEPFIRSTPGAVWPWSLG